MREIVNWVIEIYDRLRPKYYNRITWYLLIAGVGLFSFSIFKVILEAALSKEFGIHFIDENDPYFGLAIITLALVYNLIATLLHENIGYKKQFDEQSEAKEQQAKRDDFDRLKFEEIESKLGQQQLTAFLEYIGSHCAYASNGVDFIELFFEWAGNSSPEFLDQEINDAFDEMKTALRHMLNYVYQEFDQPQQHWFKLQHGYRFDETAVEFRARQEEFFKRLDAASEAYKNYRKLVREKLLV